MFRDRTNLFISFRQSHAQHPYASSQAEPLIDGAEAIEMDTLPPSWLDTGKQVDGEIAVLMNLMGRLGPLYKKNALPGFDDRTDDEREIERLSMQITTGLHRCQALVKKFDSLSKVSRGDQALDKMSNNMKTAMAAKVQDASTMFRKMQSAYLKALRKDPSYGNTGTGSGSALFSSNAAGTMEQDVQMSEQALAQSQLDLVDDAELRQREQEINKIAQGILEVADIFKDLQNLVIDQGTLIDRIDYNVESMYLSVKDADRELVKGSQYQKRTTKCKIILLLTLIIVGLFLVLIFKPRRH